MKRIAMWSAVWALTITTSFGQVMSLSDIDVWVGTGSNEAALIIDFNDGELNESFAWGYRWNGTASGADMLLAIANASGRLSVLSSGTGASGFFLSQISYFHDTVFHQESNGDFSVFPSEFRSWGYYLAGGTAGDDLAGPGGTPTPIAGGGTSLPTSWTPSPSGASLDSFGETGRILADGSWDAWSFGQNDASFVHQAPPGPENPVAAIPEPSSLLLFFTGLGFLIWNRNHSKR